MWTSPEVAPWRVSEAWWYIFWLFRSGLGWKVLDAGAVPAGRVCALNSGTASLPTSFPGWCWGLLVGFDNGMFWSLVVLKEAPMSSEDDQARICNEIEEHLHVLTPPDMRGSLGATCPANWRPSLTASGFWFWLIFAMCI